MLIITTIMYLCILLSLFPVLLSPMSLGGLLILISISLVFFISLMSSAWYGYLLFLVYIGGVLVLFIYMCIISSNTMLKLENPQSMLILFLVSFYFLSEKFHIGNAFLGKYTSDSGLMFQMTVFMSLVILLLFVFLAIVQIIGLKSSLHIETK